MSNLFSARRTQRSQLLNVVEYTSAAASAVGVVISALSQQALYAAAPLSLSLCLNLVNRRRFEQQTEQQLNGAIAQIDQRLLTLDQRVLERNEPAIEFSELRSQLSQLQDRFTTTQQGQNATATNLGQLQSRLSQLNAQLTAIQQRQAHEATSQTGLETQLSQVREDLSQDIRSIRQQVQATNLSLDGLETLQQAFSQLTDQINSLQQRQSPTATDYAELLTRFSQLDVQLAAIEQGHTDIATSETELDAQSQVRDNLSQEIQDIHQQLQRLDGLELLQQELPRLREQITFLQQRQSPTATDYAEVQARLSQIEGQLIAIWQRQAEALTASGLDAPLSQVQEVLSQEILVIREQLRATTLNLGEFQALQQEFPRLADQIVQLQAQLREIESRQTSEPADLRIENRLPPIEPPPTLVAPEFVDLPTELEPEVEQTPISPPDVERLVDLEDLVLNLGIDFGTSFTKVCFRDVARDQSEIVTFTDEVTHLEEALLPTKIGILSDGTLIAGLTASEWKPYENQVQTTVEFIKMRLANFDLPQSAESWQLKKLPGLRDAETIENLCAYYLNRVMTRAKDWVRHNKPELIINQKIDWSANVGVPVEYYDSPVRNRFQKVLSLAWLLSNEPQTEQMTIENLRDRMKPLRAKLAETAIDCHAIPEIAAEVWSLLNSREVDEGFYVLFDVGDGTLDGSSFRYWNDEGEKKVDFFFGKVNSLGVTAFSQRLAQELGIAETDAKNTICGNSTRYSDQFQTSTARNEIQRMIADVVYKGTQRYGEHGFKLTQQGFEKPLEILIGGGGGQTSFYVQTITSTHKDVPHKNYGIPEYAVRSLPFPKDLETNGIRKHEFHRFAVAYGLSIPEGEQPKLMLPSEMERIKPKAFKQDDSGQPPSYEDMRGSW